VECNLITDICLQTAQGVEFSPNYRSLVFALSVRASMQDALAQISNTAGDLARDLQIGHRFFITRYVVIVFNETSI
jgi:hypothetical protein